ncbi:MAG: LysM peptidoglycan-binding domain-containing protein [Victivallaceae bacterium]|nr:LysM peptidoglycan-binding domain-containing protein [Victivallaceae bacterium]
MKKNFLVSGGVAAVGFAVFGGLLTVGGCAGTVMGERQFVPANEKTGLEQFSGSDSAPAVVEKEAVKPETSAKEEIAPAPKKSTGGAYETFDFKKSSGVATETVAADGVYVVKSGDTLGRIAHTHGLKLAELMKLNNMTANDAKRLRVGQKLAVSSKGAAVVSKSAKSVKSAKAVKSAKSGKIETPSLTASVNDDGTYTVKRGDSIPVIARKLGVRASELQAANDLSDAATRHLQIGQKLKVPGKSAASDTAAVKPVEVAPAAGVDSAVAPAAGVAPVGDAAAPAGDAVAAPAGDAAAAPATGSEVVTGQTDLEVQTSDTTAAAVAARHNMSEEAFRKLNPTIPASGEIKKDEIIFVPAK